MQGSGKVIIIARKGDETDPLSLLICSVAGEKLSGKRIEFPCEHGWESYPLGLVIKSEEKLAVSCSECRDIKLLDLRTEEVTTAFCSKLNVLVMCYGERKTLYVHCVDDGSVLELDYSTPSFKITRTLNSGLFFCNEICYLPAPYRALAFTNNLAEIIRAVSILRNEIMWNVTGEVNGLEMQPHGLLFSPRHGLLASDRNNSRVIVCNPNEGSHLQTVNQSGLGEIYSIFLHHNFVIMEHVKNGWKISIFSQD